MTSIQATQNTITIQPLYKWDSEESQMTYLNLYPNISIYLQSRLSEQHEYEIEKLLAEKEELLEQQSAKFDKDINIPLYIYSLISQNNMNTR